MRLAVTRAADHRREADLIREASARLGYGYAECRSSDEIDAFAPDLTIALDSEAPKLSAAPGYLFAHGPRDLWLADRARLTNLLTYDGFLAISDVVAQFVSDLLHSARRDETVIPFAPTARAVSSPWPPGGAEAPVCIAPAVRDSRLEALLRQAPLARCVPLSSDWTVARQQLRAAPWVVVLADAEALAEDLVPLALFEAIASGAPVIAPRMRWIEGRFGSAVAAFDPALPPRAIAACIADHCDRLEAASARAGRPGDTAAAVFDRELSIDRLLPELVRAHCSRQERIRARARQGPSVSVVVRAGAQGPATLRRALDSIVAQHGCRLEIVVVLFARFELRQVAQQYAAEGVSVRIIERSDGDRSDTLWTGLQAATGDLVAILDDDDEWLPGHLDSLCHTIEETERPWAFSGVLSHRDRPGPDGESRWLRSFPIGALPDDPLDRAPFITIISFLFRRTMLQARDLVDPHLPTAQDSNLFLTLLEKATPAFTFRATAVIYEGEHSAVYREVLRHEESLIRLRTRFALRVFPPAGQSIPFERLRARTDRLVTGRPRLVVSEGRRRRYGVPESFRCFLGDERCWRITPVRPDAVTAAYRGGSRGAGGGLFPIRVEPPDGPWQYAVVLALAALPPGPAICRLRVDVRSGTAGFGVLTADEREFIYRVFVPASPEPTEVDLPLPERERGRIVLQSGGEPGVVRAELHGIAIIEPSE